MKFLADRITRFEREVKSLRKYLAENAAVEELKEELKHLRVENQKLRREHRAAIDRLRKLANGGLLSLHGNDDDF